MTVASAVISATMAQHLFLLIALLYEASVGDWSSCGSLQRMLVLLATRQQP